MTSAFTYFCNTSKQSDADPICFLPHGPRGVFATVVLSNWLCCTYSSLHHTSQIYILSGFFIFFSFSLLWELSVCQSVNWRNQGHEREWWVTLIEMCSSCSVWNTWFKLNNNQIYTLLSLVLLHIHFILWNQYGPCEPLFMKKLRETKWELKIFVNWNFRFSFDQQF